MLELIRKWYARIEITETASLIALSLAVGLAGGFGAVFFRWLIAAFHNLFFVQSGQVLSFLGNYYVILVPALGGLFVGPIIYFWAREARGHGVPEVMEAVALKGGRIRPRVSVVKSLASSICIGSGGSVGREGPIVQIGAAIGSTIGQWLKMSEERVKNLVACGAAAGIAATFNAPIAGVFFALEVILGEFSAGAFSSVVLASVTASIISRAFLGNYPAFEVPKYSLLSPWEIFNYFILGLLCALAALLFIKVLYWFEDLFALIRIPEYLKPVLGGLVIGVMVFFFPQIFGVGYGTITLALTGKLVIMTLIVLVLLKILATSLTIGSGGSGGVFAPSLFIGAMLGGAFGRLVHVFYPGLAGTSGAYALVGMGGVFAAAAHAPITAILILFEMTNDYRIILPLMITCVISVVVVGRLSKDNIYTLKLRRRGVKLKAGKDLDLMQSILIKEVLRGEIITVPEHFTIQQAFERNQETGHRGFPVINSKGELTGIITFQDIRKAIDGDKRSAGVTEFMTSNLVVCYPDENLNQALKKMGLRNIGRLPVVERGEEKKLLGLITRKNIISAYNRWLLKKPAGFART